MNTDKMEALIARVRAIILEKTSEPLGISRARVRDRFDGNAGTRDIAMLQLDAMLREGIVFRFSQPPLPGVGGRSAERYFDNQKNGAAWRDRRTPEAGRPRPKVTAAKVLRVVAPHWRNLTQRPEPGPVITPENVLRTVCPSAPVFSRHQVLPTDCVPSVISGADCRPWARYTGAT